MTRKADPNLHTKDSHGESAFERFETFARNLVSVPKKEIDRRAKAYERKKRGRS
jgi:hypothetical protein